MLVHYLIIYTHLRVPIYQAAIQKRAIGVLKQKRLYDGQLAQLQQQTFNMEQAAMTTENLKNTVRPFSFLSLLPGLPKTSTCQG